eukprot:CAMPEP_0197718500 /NCGR_PEP_ID=MMETSP1434-20131217/2634_1 /TAXON_ID=265543 /ORGANISM="Minutocellus polymorphus, Strain CCMP3303" /LENGTH=193 /DNA_ID=CAMNT_0043303165 /DNA_START=126 /DNA_END=708 /DNA_ORIENTATION=+
MVRSRSSVDYCNEVEYTTQIEEMSRLLAESNENLARIKELAENIKDLEIQDITLADLGSSPEASMLRRAVAEAKAAVDTFGPNSAEARLSWKDVDKATEEYQYNEQSGEKPWQSHPSYRYSAAHILAHHNYNAVVDSKVLSDAAWSIDQLDALAHFVNIEKARLVESDALHPNNNFLEHYIAGLMGEYKKNAS